MNSVTAAFPPTVHQTMHRQCCSPARCTGLTPRMHTGSAPIFPAHLWPCLSFIGLTLIPHEPFKDLPGAGSRSFSSSSASGSESSQLLPRGRPWPLSCSLGGHCPGGRQSTQVSEHEQGGFCLSPALPPRTSSPPVPRLSSESSWGNNAFFALSV